MRWFSCAFVAVAGLGLLASGASGKGLDLTLTATPAAVRVGDPVTVTLVGRADEALAARCRGMRVDVVAPGVRVGRALRSLEGGVESRRIGAWGAFRLASLRPVGELRWTGMLRPGVPGAWTLVVPNYCADGFVLPQGVVRTTVAVGAR